MCQLRTLNKRFCGALTYITAKQKLNQTKHNESYILSLCGKVSGKKRKTNLCHRLLFPLLIVPFKSNIETIIWTCILNYILVFWQLNVDLYDSAINSLNITFLTPYDWVTTRVLLLLISMLSQILDICSFTFWKFSI